MSNKCKYALADWPAADRTAWDAATSTEVDYFAQGPYAGWSPETKRQARYAYSRWLTFLSEHDPKLLGALPQDRLTPALFERFVASLAQGVKAQTVVSTLTHLINALRAVAPDYPTQGLRLVQKRFRRDITPPDKRARMEPAADVSQLGFDLMDEAPTILDPRAAARTFRDGLLIAVLMSSALRRTSLAALVVGKNFLRIGEHYQLAVDAEDVKTRTRIDQPLPDELSPYIETYLNEYRPRFPQAHACNALWLSSKSGPMCKEAIWDAVRRRTKTRFGHPINLHLCRDIAATAAPRLASVLLDHRKAGMTERYRRSDPLAASRKLGAVIAALRANAAAAKVVLRASQAPDATLPQRSAREAAEGAIV